MSWVKGTCNLPLLTDNNNERPPQHTIIVTNTNTDQDGAQDAIPEYDFFVVFFTILMIIWIDFAASPRHHYHRSTM